MCMIFIPISVKVRAQGMTSLRLLTLLSLLLVATIPVGVLAETGAAPEDLAVLDEEVLVVADDDTAAVTADTSTPEDSYRREPLVSREVFGDFVIGPGRFDVELAPGQSRTVEMTIANRMGEGKIFSFETEDMVGARDPNRTIDLLGDQEGPYSLRDFISVSHQTFFLEHGQRARVPVTITLPPDVEPGGRYGSLLVSVTSRPSQQVAAGTRSGSAIVSRIGALFFVTTPGDIVRDSSLTSFSTRNRQRFFTAGPVTFDITQENFGSVHTNPYGRMVITNILGEEVGRVNLDPWYVMPQAIRTRELTWDREFLFGRYTATAQINRGYDDIVDEKAFVFYVVPWRLGVIVFGILFLGFLLLRLFFSRFELKRKS